jgi:hypothetical protein
MAAYGEKQMAIDNLSTSDLSFVPGRVCSLWS